MTPPDGVAPIEQSATSLDALPKPDSGLIPLHRMEAFSDAVFDFAVTLLVVSTASAR